MCNTVVVIAMFHHVHTSVRHHAVYKQTLHFLNTVFHLQFIVVSCINLVVFI